MHGLWSGFRRTRGGADRMKADLRRRFPAMVPDQPPTMGASRRYLAVLLGATGAVLAAVAGLNLLLAERSLGGAEALREASAWQGRTRGVTYAPPITHSRPFKSLRLAERLPEINAMVLGSSSVMAVREQHFPDGVGVYNFGLTANPTAAVVGEAEYLERHHGDRIRLLLIGLDWSLGMLFLPWPVQEQDLSPAAALAAEAAAEAPFLRRLGDALSYPRVAILGRLLAGALRSERPAATLHQTFLGEGGVEYRCLDGVPALDLDVVKPGACRGFRYDGSFTFGGDRRLTDSGAAAMAYSAALPGSRFLQPLVEARGEPNPLYLQRLGAFASRYAEAGGEALFLLPPLVPGMEVAVLKAPATRGPLQRTKSILGEWARGHGVTVIDAGQSERFGCVAGEFVDENHAYPECYARVLSRFRADRAAGRVRPGLYAPEAP